LALEVPQAAKKSARPLAPIRRSLAKARQARDEARKKLLDGIDPV